MRLSIPQNRDPTHRYHPCVKMNPFHLKQLIVSPICHLSLRSLLPVIRTRLPMVRPLNPVLALGKAVIDDQVSNPTMFLSQELRRLLPSYPAHTMLIWHRSRENHSIIASYLLSNIVSILSATMVISSFTHNSKIFYPSIRVVAGHKVVRRGGTPSDEEAVTFINDTRHAINQTLLYFLR